MVVVVVVLVDLVVVVVGVRKPGLKTGKQHGLAGSTDLFLRHISPTPGVKTSRLNPLKNYKVLVTLWWVPLTPDIPYKISCYESVVVVRATVWLAFRWLRCKHSSQ